jgi:hypothetical protein
MNPLHAQALVSFSLAFLFYFIAWLPGLWVFAAVGIIFEIGGWMIVWLGSDEESVNPPRR